MTTSEGAGAPGALGALGAPGATDGADARATEAVAAAPAELWVERTGTRTYTGYSSRGAQVSIGPVEAGAVFTPGELLKIALAGCTGMTSDAVLARRLGDDVPVTVRVSSVAHPEEDRYTDLHEELVVDLSGLDEVARTRLVTLVQRVLDQSCTIANTLTHGAHVHLDVVEEV